MESISLFSGHLLAVFSGFFAMMNPIANTPIFLSLVEGKEPTIKRKIAFKALLYAFVIILLFSLLGKWIFQMFGITLPSFRITGGILISVIGYKMLHGDSNNGNQSPKSITPLDFESHMSIAATPLAMPLLAGPGTITTAIHFASLGGTVELILTIISFACLCLLTYICFLFGGRFVGYLGKSVLNVISRLMGLILAVIGVQMFIEGLKAAFGLSL